MIAGTAEDVSAGQGSRLRVNPAIPIRALQVLLWLLVVSGPAAALVGIAHLAALNSRLEVIESAAAVDPPADSRGAAGFAELFIAAYLDAGEGSTTGLDRFVDGVALEGVEPGSWSVGRAASLGAEEITPGYFSVTVAVDLIAHTTGDDPTATTESARTLFYSVAVAEADSGWTVVGLPSLMPAPDRVSAPELLVDRWDGVDDAGLADLVVRFLSAYLTGDGDLTRYLAPSSSTVPVHPAPFTAVEVLRSGMAEDPEQGTVVGVAARGLDAAGRAQLLEFWLAVLQRDGRWEVIEILPAPPLATSNN